MKTTNNILSKIFFFLILATGWGSGAWAQTPTVATGIYRIAASYSDDRGIIIDKGGNYVTVSKNQYNTGITAADNSNSLWYVFQSPNGCYLIASLSYYSGRNDDVYFLKGAGANTSYQTNAAVEWNFTFKTNSGRTGNNTSGFDTTPATADFYEIALASNPNQYMKSTPGYSNEAEKLRLAGTESAASYLEFQPKSESDLSSDQIALLGRINARINEYLLRFAKLPDGTKIVFENESHQPITSTSKLVKYTPAGGGEPAYLTSANATYDFNDVFYDPAAFSGTFDYSLKGVNLDTESNTLTFTLAFNKWYRMKVANNNSYVSSDYADTNGMRLASGQASPNNYAGIWRSGDAGGEALNSNGHNVSLYNAKFYDTKLLAMTNPANDGQSRGAMYASNEVPAGAATVYEQRVNPSQADSYYFRITGNGVNTNTYINLRNPYFSNWTSGGYGGSGSQFVIEEVPTLGEDVKVVVNAPGGESILYSTQCEAYNSVFGVSATDVVMSSQDHYNFHNMPYLESLFRYEPTSESKFLTVNFDPSTQTLTLSVVEDPNILQFSPEPSRTEWAEGTKWFTWRNNRPAGSGNNPPYRYVSTSEDFVNDQWQMTNTCDATSIDDRGGIWAFVGTETGFQIYNAAYGPEFVFARTSNGYTMVRRDEPQPAGTTTTFTYEVATTGQSNFLDGASHGYVFRIGTTGSDQIHSNVNGLISWNGGGSLRKDDGGSVFKVTAVEDVTFDALPEYEVYYVETTGSAAVDYNGSRAVFGKRGTSPYFILAKGDPEITQGDINSAREIESFDIDANPSGTYIKHITLALAYPVIIHRTPWYVDAVNASSSVPPVNTGFLQQDTDNKGMVANPHTATSIQRSPVFEMTEYMLPGGSKRIWLPTCNTNGSNSSLWSYQRWYDYKTEGLVDSAVYDFATQKPNGEIFKNGYVTGAIYGDFIGKEITVNLPNGKTSYDIALDHSRYEDYKKNCDGAGNLLEPTISQRVIYHLVDANVMAQALDDLADDEWLEEQTIHFPSRKMGSKDARNGFDIIGLEHTFGNYWYYADATAKTNKTPSQVAREDDFEFEVECSDESIINPKTTLGVSILKKNNNTMPAALNLQLPSTFSSQRFVMFNYPESRRFKDQTEVVIKVKVHGKRVAKFTLVFVEGTEPLPILDVIGKTSDNKPISARSTAAMIEQNGQPIAKVTFDAPEIAFRYPTSVASYDPATKAITYNWSATNSARYGLPLSNQYTDYSFFAGGGSGNNQYMAMGEYRLESSGNGTSGRAKVRTIEEYEHALGVESELTTNGYKQYFAFADVSEMPGKILSVPFSTTLCSGQRVYMQGWVASATSVNDNGQQQSGVILNVYGIKSGQRTLIYSYCPGIISSAVEKDGVLYKAVENDFSGYRQSVNDNGDWNNQGFVIWNQVNCSFLVTGSMQFDSYQLEVDNNSYSSTGCDVMVDNFCVFAAPPKGDVDFTTPLCSDKVRHAKVHADYDMLRNLNNINENDPSVQLTASYCFLEADVFDSFTENDLHITDLFEIDDQGNHSLKPEFDEGDETIKSIINHAFHAALVGRRCTKDAKDDEGLPYEDHGFHSYYISTNYESIPSYAYNDSKSEIVYREIDETGVRRVVFKEDVVRGEMDKVKDADGHYFYPHLRPSTTYYLVFSARLVDDEAIADVHVATDVFNIHQSCSFFGKFTTKDPMHVILDNAEIESDLPMKAICHGEAAEFQFDMPALKADKPVYDEEFCISDADLDGKMVPSSFGSHHYRFESSFNNDAVYGVIKNLPYDWWLGGKYDATHTYRGTIEGYRDAVHPTLTYIHPEHDHTHAADYKKDGEPVDIALAMENFRFYYPDFGLGKTDIYGVNTLTAADWEALTPHDYNNDSGYSLLQSEINAIRDLVEKGIIVLYRNTYDMPLTLERAEELNLKELSDMMEAELNTQVLALAIMLNDPSIVALKPLRQLEASVLNLLTDAGRKALTFEEFGNLSHSELKTLVETMVAKGHLNLTSEQINAMSESALHKAAEAVLDEMDEATLREFAKTNFPDLTHEERAYLVVRALNLLSKEVYASMTEAELQNTALTRQKLREMMISVFVAVDKPVLKKMLDDTTGKLTEEERAALLKDKDLENETVLAELIEAALAKITDKVIKELSSDRYIHFTLLPIMPSQDNFVDEPYIFCPDPRGVKIRVTTNEPRMFDGFADMPYPDDMDNVPVRMGLTQIDAVPYNDAEAAKTLRMPLRRLGSAQKNGTHEMHLQGSGYVDYLYLVETNDPNYQYGTPEVGVMKPAVLVEGGKPGDKDAYRLVAKVKQLQAVYTRNDNYMDLQFDPAMKFREGYTYRLGFNFMEFDEQNDPTISCYGTMFFDMKIVPEYQKWTGAVSDDWTNDKNWQRADRTVLHADNLPTGEVITGSTAFAKATADDADAANRYPTNEINKTSESFVPMAFTNTLIAAGAARMPGLYNVVAPQRGRTEMVDGKEVIILGHFLGGSDPDAAGALRASASDLAKYDMEVYDATNAWHKAGNYECGLFGTYVAKGITFEPATMLYNAQLLDYQKAWVEYILNANRWYTIASPLQETFSGEWYSPTGSGADKGKQLTPHFYDINYNVALNNRFNPAYYQRSWDQGTANMFRCFDESHDSEGYYLPNEKPLNVAIGLDWSHVYNDVKVDYSNGGFSVKPAFDDDSEGQVLVRMPKADASYLYFDEGDETDNATHRGDETSITRGAGHYRLISDKLATADSFTQSITNANGADNPYYLVANPFMAPMDMTEFFTANPQFEAGKFWIMTNSLQEVNMKTANGWISTTGDGAEGAVAPLQAFFVKLATPTAAAVNVTYNKAMQKTLDANATVPVLKAPARKSSSSLSSSSSMVFRIEATGADGALQSQAAVVFSETADNAFRATEDAELLLDGNTAEEVATVFTTAPTAEMGEAQAMQFNALSRTVTTIPLGVIAPTDDTLTTLTFTGITALADAMEEAPYLYDAANGSFTVLDEETTLTVEGTSAGRYFIVSGMHMPYDDATDNDAPDGQTLDTYNLHGIRVATPQRGTVTIRGSRKEFNR